MRLRYLSPHKQFSPEALRRLTQIDYDREMAFVAISPDERMGGIARISIKADRIEAEFSILVRSDLQGHGLGRSLLEQLIDFARADGISRLEGLILSENTKMLALCREFSFALRRALDEPGLMQANLNLKA
jgi:acetyltransferase